MRTVTLILGAATIAFVSSCGGTSSSGCSQWETIVVDVDHLDSTDETISTEAHERRKEKYPDVVRPMRVHVVPAGWEPASVSTGFVLLRRCKR